MAHLTSGDESRGQLLLVTALGLAVLFVVLTVVLNAAIHTEVLASTGGRVDETGALAYRTDAGRQMATLLADTDAGGGSYRTLRENFSARVAAWQTLAGRLAAADGGDRAAAVEGVVNGTRLAQTNRSRAYVNRSGASSWTLATGVTGLRDARLTVSRDSLAAPGDDTSAAALSDAGAFAAVVDGADGRWRVFVYRSGTDVVVRVADGGALGPRCPVTSPTATVDVTNASVGGRACPSLDFLDGVERPFDVSYARGDAATGTYTLVVDRPVSDVADDDVWTTGDSPAATPTLYAATVRLTYETPRTSYVTTVRVLPEVAR